jgi:chromate reductase, NAD(P)H dehydrogenase (quinone)
MGLESDMHPATQRDPTGAESTVIGICGSLRQDSYNAMALSLAARSMPPGMRLDTFTLHDIPLFNGDLLAQGYPPEVKDLREKIRSADAVLLASPEYNFSISGVLKNALDWVSRGADQPLAGKPVAILSASTGPYGGARSQYDLRKVLLFMNAMVLMKPEVFIGSAGSKFDPGGVCTDEATHRAVGGQMVALQEWIVRVRRMNAPG